MQISVSSDFTKYPGARFKTDGNFSGEQFYEDLLLKKYEEALSKNERLIVSFDGVSWNPPSFLSESFWRLCKRHGWETVWQQISVTKDIDLWFESYVKELSRKYVEE